MRRVLPLLTAVLGLSGLCHASIIYDNGGPNTDDSGNETTQWVQADNFSIAGGGTVRGGGVYIGFEGSINDWDGTFDYYFFGDNAGSPGPQLASGSSTVAPSSTGILWCCGGPAYLFPFVLEAPFVAAAGTTYWFGIHLSTDFTRDNIYWITNALGNTHESGGGTFDNWSDNGRDRAFYLTDTAEIPEPGTAGLLALGLLAALGFSRSRNSRGTSPAA